MPTGGSAEENARKQRLAAALRDNLKRRKAQARARQGGEPATPPAAPATDPKEGGQA